MSFFLLLLNNQEILQGLCSNIIKDKPYEILTNRQ